MKKPNDDKLIEFLKSNDSEVPPAPLHEFARIQNRMEASALKKFSSLLIWVPAAAILTLTVLIVRLPTETPTPAQDAIALSQFIWDSYDYADEFDDMSEDL